MDDYLYSRKIHFLNYAPIQPHLAFLHCHRGAIRGNADARGASGATPSPPYKISTNAKTPPGQMSSLPSTRQPLTKLHLPTKPKPIACLGCQPCGTGANNHISHALRYALFALPSCWISHRVTDNTSKMSNLAAMAHPRPVRASLDLPAIATRASYPRRGISHRIRFTAEAFPECLNFDRVAGGR
jgi:hypothetical protein